MKKLVISILLFCSLTAFSQDKKHLIKVMYSPFSMMQQAKWLNNDIYHDKSGTFTIEYNYFFKDRWKLGACISYEQGNDLCFGTYEYRIDDYHSKMIEEQYNRNNYWWSFTPQIGYEYFRTDNFRMGSAIGVSFIYNRKSVNNKWFLDKEYALDVWGHIELVNFTWGKTHGLTGQVGFGMKGVVSIGYFVKLSRS